MLHGIFVNDITGNIINGSIGNFDNIIFSNGNASELILDDLYVDIITGFQEFISVSNINNLTATGISVNILSGNTINANIGNFLTINISGQMNNINTNFLNANIFTGS